MTEEQAYYYWLAIVALAENHESVTIKGEVTNE
jgi:hypothetical protein